MAIGIEYLGPIAFFWVPGLGRSTTADWNIEGGHMAERCGLFIIIALGESILVIGATFANLARCERLDQMLQTPGGSSPKPSEPLNSPEILMQSGDK